MPLIETLGVLEAGAEMEIIGSVPVAVEVAIAHVLAPIEMVVVAGFAKLIVPASIVIAEVDAAPKLTVPAFMATVDVAPVPITMLPLLIAICADVADEEAILFISPC